MDTASHLLMEMIKHHVSAQHLIWGGFCGNGGLFLWLHSWFQEEDGVHPYNNSKREKVTSCLLLDSLLFLLLWSKLFAEETKHWAAIIDCSSWSVIGAWEHCGEVVPAQDNIAVRVEKTQWPAPFTTYTPAKCQMQNISTTDGFSPLSVKKVTWGVGGALLPRSKTNCY